MHSFYTSNRGCDKMAVLTEGEVRKRLSREDLKALKEFKVVKGEIITPSAKSYLAEHNINLVYVNSEEEKLNKETEPKEIIREVVREKEYKYETVFGAKLDEKPEHMTHLTGNLLVFKDHKRIIFRGKIDSLEARIVETQILCHKKGMNKLVEDLQEILTLIGRILRCEVLSEPLEGFSLQGMTEKDLREKSHNPKKYFGIGHEMPTYEMGEIVAALNILRTLTRETELSAYEAFKGEYGQVEREDLIRALNRLSSVFWIMIFKVRTGKYEK